MNSQRMFFFKIHNVNSPKFACCLDVWIEIFKVEAVSQIQH
jgi:hypothetical protein